MEQGWIKLYRRFVDWEWYSDINAKVVFIHLLLTANHKENNWRGNAIKRGQTLTSLEHLARETGLTVQKVRTALNKLKSTNEITIKSTNKNTLITIEKWELYQSQNEEVTNKITSCATNEQQTSNKQITTNKNEKNEKNEKNNTISKDIVCSTKVQRIIEKWNELGLKKIMFINPGTKRYTLLNTRLKEYGEDKVVQAIENINKSSFLKGQNKRSWVVTFDWFVKPNNFIKVLEENYTDENTADKESEKNNTNEAWCTKESEDFK